MYYVDECNWIKSQCVRLARMSKADDQQKKLAEKSNRKLHHLLVFDLRAPFYFPLASGVVVEEKTSFCCDFSLLKDVTVDIA